MPNDTWDSGLQHANAERFWGWGLLQTAAVDAMTACCSVVGNRDVEPFVPTLIGCIARPAEVAEGIHKLGAITFVQVRPCEELSLWPSPCPSPSVCVHVLRVVARCIGTSLLSSKLVSRLALQ